MITVSGLSVRHLRDVSLTVTQGALTVVLGANGSGKSTLLSTVAGLVAPEKGSVTTSSRPNMLMQESEYVLFGQTPLEELLLSYPNPDDRLIDCARDVLCRYGMNPEGAVATLSFGQKRKLALLTTLFPPSNVLLLDEPTAGLDPSERIRFRNLISELSEDRIVLLSTHIVSDIEYIAGDILLMKDGCLSISGTAEELINSMPEPVWSCTVPKSRIDACLKAYKVANVKTIPVGAELRIVSRGRPTEDAVRVEPTLEDVFLCYFGERTGDSDGTV